MYTATTQPVTGQTQTIGKVQENPVMCPIFFVCHNGRWCIKLVMRIANNVMFIIFIASTTAQQVTGAHSVGTGK